MEGNSTTTPLGIYPKKETQKYKGCSLITMLMVMKNCYLNIQSILNNDHTVKQRNIWQPLYAVETH